MSAPDTRTTVAPGLLARWEERLDAIRTKGANRDRRDFVLQLDIIDTFAHLRRLSAERG